MKQKQDNHFNRARASLQQAISWYGNFRRHGQYPPDETLQTTVRDDLKSLKNALDKLDCKVLRISTFGLVSCGKSSVINALVGQEVFKTGALNGVTQFPQSISWQPESEEIEVELIDTPGIDEMGGEARANMAREIAQKSDLILFVLAGDITRTEYLVLSQLRQSQKPIVIVFNKIDLYPDKDRQSIYNQLQLVNSAGIGDRLEQFISQDEIVMVSAKPQPIQVRQETSEGIISHTWETAPPQITELEETILRIISREGRSLLALNALVQARNAETNIARKTIAIRGKSAQDIIWQYAKYKTLAVAANPVPLLDVAGGFLFDLGLIRALAKLYGLPITGYEAGELWRKILASSGGLLLGEISSNLVLGVGKGGAAMMAAFNSPGAFITYTGTAGVQGAIAGYGAYVVGKVTQVYLEQGCTWGDLGASTVIAEILSQVEPNTIIYRLKQELW
ncbi:Small GTP-binding protein domain protein [Hyella patelloides LEGE 07179]|uniref:Small GTP-binding protein domain protein n=1 Tax=Hyella patelloides LEGE 07179 TaxID=945734 RepID=A0A563VTE1_9CYAN|nr:DUF697 domain-containing protein [Hyella patelloides]VEP14668.1 Small GTP-binding protein domain protein [Hyella patelloides LEGE 07179]